MEFNELYQEVILDHFRHPRNYHPFPDADVLVDEENPTCGDHIRLKAAVKEGRIVDLQFDGKGCAISMASASMMTERLMNSPVEEARRLIADFVALIRGEKEIGSDDLGDLVALEGVKNYPLRVKCATMSWHALRTGLDKISPLAS